MWIWVAILLVQHDPSDGLRAVQGKPWIVHEVRPHILEILYAIQIPKAAGSLCPLGLFRRIDVRTGGCRAPFDPAIFVANHPNVALDVLLLSCHLPARTPRFLGKSTLFSNPIFNLLLRGLGVIPVVRSREGVSSGRNRDMLRSSCRALQGGESLVLFPEGLSHPCRTHLHGP